jgi:hypothetical protein
MKTQTIPSIQNISISANQSDELFITNTVSDATIRLHAQGNDIIFSTTRTVVPTLIYGCVIGWRIIGPTGE